MTATAHPTTPVYPCYCCKRTDCKGLCTVPAPTMVSPSAFPSDLARYRRRRGW